MVTPINEIYKFLSNFLNSSDILINVGNILISSKIDLYLPKYKIGINFNDFKNHSEENNMGRNSHVIITNEALSKNIFLIQIFEDEWIEHKEIVLEKIKHFIGKSNNKVIGARKCFINEVSKAQAKDFLDKFHIQGYVSSTIYLGAFYNNELVSVMSFLEEKKGYWNLTRFASNTNYSLPGLANKLFKHFINSNKVIECKTFLDRRWAHNKVNVYDKMRFELVEILPPDYRYLVNGQRCHKFAFRKQKLNKKYGVPLSMTEYEMTQSLGFYRIWDCGLYKYVWKNNTNDYFFKSYDINMQLSKNFSLAEMTASDTAKRSNIDNTPNNEELENLKKLCNDVLQPIREKYGEAIIVSSGFRCDALNTKIGGAKNSDHKFGCAADIHTSSDKLSDNMKLFKIITKMAKDGKIHCRQIIFEYGNKSIGPDWIHVSINNTHNSKLANQIVYIGSK